MSGIAVSFRNGRDRAELLFAASTTISSSDAAGDSYTVAAREMPTISGRGGRARELALSTGAHCLQGRDAAGPASAVTTSITETNDANDSSTVAVAATPTTSGPFESAGACAADFDEVLDRGRRDRCGGEDLGF